MSQNPLQNMHPGDHYTGTDLHADGSSDTSNVSLGTGGAYSDTETHHDGLGDADAYTVNHGANGDTSYATGDIDIAGNYHIHELDVHPDGTMSHFEAHGDNIHDLGGSYGAGLF